MGIAMQRHTYPYLYSNHKIFPLEIFTPYGNLEDSHLVISLMRVLVGLHEGL